MQVSGATNIASPQQLNAFIQRRLNAPDKNGQMNQFQKIDQLDISPQAKQLLETQQAQQITSLRASNQGQPLSTTQRQYIFNGSVAKAINAYKNGSGSLDQLESAMSARGQRIGATVATNAATPASTSTAPATTTTAPAVSA